MAKKNWIYEILGGQIGFWVIQNIRFVLFFFILTITYIAINFSMERNLILERQNMRELIHLKSDYTSKSSRLQYESKRVEVENKLKALNSALKTPEDPPKRVVID